MQPDPIYDPQEDDRFYRPQLKALEGGGETSDPKRGHLRDASKPQNDAAKDEAASLQHLTTMQGSVLGVVNFAKTNRGKLIVGGAVAGFVSLIIVGFIALLPLKIMHIMNNVQSRFYAGAENATQRETDSLMSTYLRKYALNKLDPERCRSTINKDCKARVVGDNLVQRLYRGWAQSNLEEKLAEKYGLELEVRRAGGVNHYWVKTPGLPDANIDDFVSSKNNMDIWDSKGFQKVSKSQVREIFHSAYAGETRWKQVMYRFKVGRLLESKFGIKRCLVFCDTKDNLSEWKNKKKQAALVFLTQRILVPRSEMTQLLVLCIIEGCDMNSITSEPEVPQVDEEGCKKYCLDNGDPRSATEREVSSRLASMVAAWRLEGPEGEKKIKQLLSQYDEWSKKGFLAALTSKASALIVSRETPEGKAKAGKAAEQLSSVLRQLGYISFVHTAYKLIHGLPTTLQKMNYVMNSSTMVGFYSMYRTYSDECAKNGKTCDAEILGSMTDALSAGNHNPDNPNDHEYGGTAEAEGAPLYGALLGGNSTGGRNILSSLFGGKALAATTATAKPSYSCYDGKKDYPLPAGKLVCPEEELGGMSAFAAKIKELFDGPIGQAMDAVDETFDRILTLINKLIGYLVNFLANLPLIRNLVEQIISLIRLAAGRLALDKFLEAILQYMLKPPPVGTNNSGGRTFDMIAGGGDVSGNDFTHHGLGGQTLSAQQLLTILNDQQQEKLQQYRSKSFFARMFDTESDYSPVSKLAMAVPFDARQGASGAFASFLANPLAKITSGFGLLFNNSPAYAAATATDTVIKDPFGVSQYGIPQGPLIIRSGDPEKPGPLDGQDLWSVDQSQFWDEYCVSGSPYYITDNWNKPFDEVSNPIGYRINPETVMPENDTPNPCLLVQSAVGSAGANFSTDVLTPDDLAGSQIVSAPSTGEAVPPSTPTGDSTTPCDSRTQDLGVYTGYQNGSPVQIRLCSVPNLPCSNEECNGGYGIKGANGHALVNSTVSKNFYELVAAANAAGVSLSANSTFRTIEHQQALCPCDGVRVAKPGYSNHQMGYAIDFAGLPSSAGPVPGNSIWNWLSANANKFGIYNYQAEAWHWSVNGH